MSTKEQKTTIYSDVYPVGKAPDAPDVLDDGQLLEYINRYFLIKRRV